MQEQLTASDPQRSVWVSASAGTGKTKILTDRVLRLLLAGAKPGSILCITFTKAAAAEMQERIERQLGEWAVADDLLLRSIIEKLTGEKAGDAVLHRARQLFAVVLDAPEKLHVQTIHSFCQGIIARFPLEAGVSPHVQLLDDRDAEDMLLEARRQLFADSQNCRNKSLVRVLAALATSMAESTLGDLLQTIIMERRKFIPWLDTSGGVEKFSSILHEKLRLATGTNETKLTAHYFNYTPEQTATLKHACAQLQQAGGSTNTATANNIASWLEGHSDALAYATSYFTEKGTLRARLFTKDALAIAGVIQQEAARAEGFMKAYKTMRVIESSENMLTLAQALLGHYRTAKAKRGVMDYDDLIMLTLQLFRRSGAASWVLFKLDSGLDHLLVDEAQDTSPQQWQIIEALVNEFFAGATARTTRRTLFVVGDEKQSIFSFQGADPHLFDSMRRMLSKKAEDAEKLFSHVRLGLSFRSTESVLAAVDSVFATPEAKSGLVFSERDLSHSAFRVKQAGRVEFWPLIEAEPKAKKSNWDAQEEKEYSPSPQQCMADRITREIAAWIRDKRQLPARARPVRPGDIMILVQRRGSFVEAMVRSLKRAGIAVAGADRLVVTNHIAVMDCMALGDFLLLPQDDLTLAALLKSPFVGLDEEALFTLAHNRGDKTLWQSLSSHPAYAEETEFLRQMLARADYMPPYELFTHALTTLGKRRKIAQRLGREAEDPLNEFLSLALQYERSHPPSLQGFLHWLRSSETDIKRDMEKARDEVRILTVHASKGLQAPIVFLPDTVRVPPAASNLQWLATEPPMPLWTDSSTKDDETMQTLRQATREESFMEYRRLLYVAMTRSEDELYISGWKGNKTVQKECWYELVKNAVESSGKWQPDGDRKLLVNAGADAVKAEAATEDESATPLPHWALQAAPPEPTPTNPLTPSHLADDMPTSKPHASATARARGVLVHRLLQYLPDCPPQMRGDMLASFVARYGGELSLQQREDVARQVNNVLNHSEFSTVFSPDSVAEAPIVGMIEDEQGQKVTVSGQIDRLSVVGDTVLIVDYKTGKDVPTDSSQIPAGYLRQMKAYRALVQKIYPGKAVKCGLLWTSVPTLIVLDETAGENKAA